MEEGWIYVLVNSSMPGMAKVGRTTRGPHDRASELSGVTGIATPFIVAYEQAFTDCHAAERAIHAELDRRGLRVSPNREFFRGAASEIIRLILQFDELACAMCDTAATLPPSQTACTLLAAGDSSLHGLGDTLQDTGEAVRLYKLAAARGSLDAYERLGTVYVWLLVHRQDRASRRRALAVLKEGVRRGNPYCWCGLSDVFALEGHEANTAKAWALFFAQATDRASDSFGHACSRYITQCLDLRVAPSHLPELRQAGDALLGALLTELDLVRASSGERRRLAGSLRWAYANVLSPTPAAAPTRSIARRLGWVWGVGAAA